MNIPYAIATETKKSATMSVFQKHNSIVDKFSHFRWVKT